MEHFYFIPRELFVLALFYHEQHNKCDYGGDSAFKKIQNILDNEYGDHEIIEYHEFMNKCSNNTYSLKLDRRSGDEFRFYVGYKNRMYKIKRNLMKKENDGL